MDWADLNETVMAAVRALRLAGLPHIARELYQVTPVENESDYSRLIDRVATVKTLLRLRPPPAPVWRKCEYEMLSLFEELTKR